MPPTRRRLSHHDARLALWLITRATQVASFSVAVVTVLYLLKLASGLESRSIAFGVIAAGCLCAGLILHGWRDEAKRSFPNQIQRLLIFSCASLYFGLTFFGWAPSHLFTALVLCACAALPAVLQRPIEDWLLIKRRHLFRS